MGREKPFYGWSVPDHRHHLVNFVGEAFMLSAAGVSAFQFVRGLRGAPSGVRLAAGSQAVRANMPRVVGSFTQFSVVYCAAECAASVARGGKQDAWNSIAAGAGASGLKDCRGGAFVAARAALIGSSAAAVFHTAFDWADRRMAPLPCRPTPMKPGLVANRCHRANATTGKSLLDKDGHV